MPSPFKQKSRNIQENIQKITQEGIQGAQMGQIIGIGGLHENPRPGRLGWVDKQINKAVIKKEGATESMQDRKKI